jgi:hypothetical protein
LTSFRDTPRTCQSRQACLVNLRCISTAEPRAAKHLRGIESAFGCDRDSTGQAPLPRTPHSGTSKKLARLFPYFEVVVAGGPESKIKVIALPSASSGRLRNLTQSLACLSAGN